MIFWVRHVVILSATSSGSGACSPARRLLLISRGRMLPSLGPVPDRPDHQTRPPVYAQVLNEFAGLVHELEEGAGVKGRLPSLAPAPLLVFLLPHHAPDAG